jgi:hypothetical protein
MGVELLPWATPSLHHLPVCSRQGFRRTLDLARDPLSRPDNCAACARIACHFLLGRPKRSPGQKPKRGDMATPADRQGGRAEALRGFATQILLHFSIFERMETDDHEASAVVVRVSKEAEQTVGARKSFV